DLAKEKESRVTTGGTEKKPHGLAEFVAQEEMNRFSGYWWSPDSKSIAYQETDHDGVEVWYVSDAAKPEQPPSNQFYPRPGKKNAQVRLGIIPITGGKTTWVEWDGKKYEYLASVHWGKHGPLAISLQDRTQKLLDVWVVDAETGKLAKKLHGSTSDTWVEIDQRLPHFLPDGSFLWASDAGLTRFGKRLSGLSVGPGPVYRELLSVDDKAGQVYFLGNDDDKPPEVHVYRSALPAGREPFGKPEPLSKGVGQHSAVFSKDHSLYALSTTTPGAMPRTTVHKADGTKVGELPSVAEEPPFKPNAAFGKAGGRARQ